MAKTKVLPGINAYFVLYGYVSLMARSIETKCWSKNKG